MNAALAADVVDRHDVRMLQVSGRLRLVLETLQLLGVQRRGERQDLQGHAPPQGVLLGLVDDAHAAAADFAEDAEVAQDPGHRAIAGIARQAGRRRQPDDAQGGQDLAQHSRCLRVTGSELGRIRPVAAFLPLQELIHHAGYQRFQHGTPARLHGSHELDSNRPWFLSTVRSRKSARP